MFFPFIVTKQDRCCNGSQNSVVSLMDNAANYLVGCVIQKRNIVLKPLYCFGKPHLLILLTIWGFPFTYILLQYSTTVKMTEIDILIHTEAQHFKKLLSRVPWETSPVFFVKGWRYILHLVLFSQVLLYISRTRSHGMFLTDSYIMIFIPEYFQENMSELFFFFEKYSTILKYILLSKQSALNSLISRKI